MRSRVGKDEHVLPPPHELTEWKVQAGAEKGEKEARRRPQAWKRPVSPLGPGPHGLGERDHGCSVKLGLRARLEGDGLQ